MLLLPLLHPHLLLFLLFSSAYGSVVRNDQPPLTISVRRSALTNSSALLEVPKNIFRQLPGGGLSPTEFGALEEHPLNNFHGLLLYGTVQMGTPGQPLQLGFTFHRNQFWVYGEHSKPPANRVKHEVAKFRQSNSTSFIPGNLDFRLPFRLATGKYATDLVRLSDKQFEIQFGVCDSANFMFGMLPIDGEFGIGPNPKDNQGIQSPLNKLFEQYPLISVWVNRQSVLFEGEGAITFDLDTKNCKDYGFVKMADTGGWHFDLHSVTVGTKEINARGDKVRISDENHVIYGPRSQVSRILEPIGAMERGIGTWYVNCDAIATAPDLVFNLGPSGEVKVAIPPDVYIVQVPKMENCLLTIMSYPDPIVSYGWVVGESFYDGRCIALDWPKRMIGFGTMK